jgi:hypothetical protein
MRYQLKQIHCRPWLLLGLSPFHVGCRTAVALREAGFDAKYMKGGYSGWKALGGPVRMNP